jgi:TPR repeat protein
LSSTSSRTVFTRIGGGLATLLSASLLVSCGGAAAKAIQPEAPTAKTALEGDDSSGGTCTAVADVGNPLIVDWRPDQRGDLEVAMKQGVVVAHYDCNTLKLLPSCRVEGTYGFMAVTKKEQIVRLLSADDAKINLPLNGASIGAEMKDGTALDIALIIVGQAVTTHGAVAPEHLVGDCKEATHFVRAATIGAFAMDSSSAADIKTSAQIFGIGGAAGSSSSKSLKSKDGEMDACAKAHADSKAPPDQCGAVLRLTLAAIGGKAPPPPPTTDTGEASDKGENKAEVGCPRGYVLSQGKCTKPTKAVPHLCKVDDLAECAEQCELAQAQSCRLLASFYEFGKSGTKVDKPRALELYTKACDGGDAIGCSSAGYLYDVPNPPIPPDMKKAVALETKACDMGDPRGCSNLGVKYGTGSGVTMDKGKATSLYEKSCNGGFAMGCFNLGIMYTNGPAAYSGPDAPKAFNLFKRACEGNVPRGCNKQGEMTQKGLAGVPADLTKAVGLFDKACNQGWAYGCGNLGVSYDLGLGITADAVKATPLLKKGCDGGLPSACRRLAVHYMEGTGVAVDPLQAVSLYSKACNSTWDTDGPGCAGLARANEWGEGGLAVDLVKATDLYKKACTLGDADSCARIKAIKPGAKTITATKNPKPTPVTKPTPMTSASVKPPIGAPTTKPPAIPTSAPTTKPPPAPTTTASAKPPVVPTTKPPTMPPPPKPTK